MIETYVRLRAAAARGVVVLGGMFTMLLTSASMAMAVPAAPTGGGGPNQGSYINSGSCDAANIMKLPLIGVVSETYGVVTILFYSVALMALVCGALLALVTLRPLLIALRFATIGLVILAIVLKIFTAAVNKEVPGCY
ncbi:hypothetical protein HJC99_03255 [Candidatus Saccharibacteria bacterium]|nr:hypothetical protein [Candidatus Saccharibacteria bacterium]